MTDDVPPMPIQLREGFDGVSSGTQMVTPRRDLLEGLIGGLLFVQDTPPMKQIEQQEPAAAPQPEQQRQTTAMATTARQHSHPTSASVRACAGFTTPKTIIVTGVAQLGDSFLQTLQTNQNRTALRHIGTGNYDKANSCGDWMVK